MILSFCIVFLLEVSTAKETDITTCNPSGVFIDGLANPIGDIYSPGYKEGEHYTNDLYCEYTVEGPEGYRVKLTFESFDVEPAVLCGRDYVEAVEGGGDHKSLGTFCGNVTIPPVLSQSNTLRMRFVTDSIGTRRGFHIRYQASNTIKSLCKEGETLCRNRLCYPSEKKCDGTDDCGDGTDEEKCDYPLPVSECGKREISQGIGRDRVIGGNAAIPGSWPWQAALHMAYAYSSGQTCGGTLINAQWVLTAAHCVEEDGKYPDKWRVHLGKHHTFKIDESEQIRYVERIIVYPGITGEALINKSGNADLTNDYTLMKLNAPVKFTKEVRPACLPEKDFVLSPGKKCWGTGWGTTRGTGADYALKELDLTVVDRRKCKVGNLDTRICTKNEKGFQDLCHGDSGGPFVCEFDSKWYVMGITSFGTFGTDGHGLCGMPENFAIFARVAKKVDWIREQINKYS